MLGSVSKAVDQDLSAEKVIRTNPRDRPASTATVRQRSRQWQSPPLKERAADGSRFLLSVLIIQLICGKDMARHQTATITRRTATASANGRWNKRLTPTSKRVGLADTALIPVSTQSTTTAPTGLLKDQSPGNSRVSQLHRNRERRRCSSDSNSGRHHQHHSPGRNRRRLRRTSPCRGDQGL